MIEDLLPYYERELGHLRALAGEFAERYPKVARRLQVDLDHCEDPHVERLIEAFAFLAARIHRKLDDEYPEIAESFMEVLYPHFLRPVPSATILQMIPDTRETGIPGCYRVPRHAAVFAPPVQGLGCQFRTCSDVELWPLRVARARLELTRSSGHLQSLTSAQAVITLDLAAMGGAPIGSLGLDRLRFFLDGEPPLMHLLYELLFFRLQEVRASDGREDPARTVTLPPGSVRQVGFSAEDALIGDEARSFPGFRLLSEYFAFPEKFMFLEVAGLEALEGCADTLRLRFMVSPFGNSERHHRLVETLSAANFKLGCVPIVNLFRHPGTPIRVDHHQLSYPVTPDNRNMGFFEVHSIDAVTRVVDGHAEESTEEVPPFYCLCHASGGREPRFYWWATREPSRRLHDKGTEVELSLVDLDFRPVRPEAEILSLELTCTNRDLPASLPFGGGPGSRDAFALPGHPVVRYARPLRKPSPSLRLSSKRGLQWRLISQMSLNHLSMASQGPRCLQETLELYNFTGSAAAARQIQGLAGLTARPATARLPGRAFAAFVRGVEVEATFDEACYAGSGLFLFASVLERFLALSCPANSFVRFRMRTLQQEGEVAQWPPRAGETALI